MISPKSGFYQQRTNNYPGKIMCLFMNVNKMIGDKDAEKTGRARQALLKMRNFDFAPLKRAHAGR